MSADNLKLTSRLKQYLLLRLFFLVRLLVRVLPMRLSFWLGSKIGGFIQRFCPREEKISLTQIQYVKRNLKVDSPLHRLTAEEISKKTFQHVGQAVVEVLLLKKLLEKNKLYSSDNRSFKYVSAVGQEKIDRYLQEKKGFVTLSAHLGCFELLAAYQVKYGAKIAVVARNPNYSAFSTVLGELRDTYGVETIWRHQQSSARRMVQALKEGCVIAVLIDQDTALGNAFAPFFGLEAAYPEGPIKLALSQNVPIFTSFIVRSAANQHTVITDEIIFNPENDDAIKEILKVFNQRLERLICQYPEQWIWWHKRWRRRPEIDYKAEPAKLLNSADYINWLAQR